MTISKAGGGAFSITPIKKKEYNYKCEICEKRKPKSQMQYNQGNHYSCKECCNEVEEFYDKL